MLDRSRNAMRYLEKVRLDSDSDLQRRSSYIAQHMGTKSKSSFNSIFLSALMLKRAKASPSSGLELVDILEVWRCSKNVFAMLPVVFALRCGGAEGTYMLMILAGLHDRGVS
jgi:hypothetical protein